MQLSARTIAILKDFYHINPGIVFTPGKMIRVCDTGDQPSIIAMAEIDDAFETSFAISDISQFLSVLSSFENPQLNFKEKYLFISQDKREVQYTYGNADFIKSPETNEVAMPKTITTFKLSEADLNKLTRISSVLHFPDIAIVGEKPNLYLRGLDVKNPTNNLYNHQLECTVGNNFTTILRTEKVEKLMSMDYDVTVSEGVVQFVGKDISYWMASEEKDSEYNK